jgi:hypothetical protein
MSIFIKGRLAVVGLAVLLSAPVFGQADSSAAGYGKRIHFDNLSVHDDNDGGHKTYSVLADDEDGNIYRMRKVDGRIVELEVNGKPVPREQYARYEKLLGHFEKPVPPVPPVPPVAPAGPAAPVPPAAPGTPGALAAPAAPAAPVAPAMAEPVTPAAPAAPAASQVVPAPPASPLPPTPPAPPEPPRANKYISHIIDDLENKGIINDESKLNFLLDNEQMTVNGVKQPDDVFQFFKQKYIKHAGDHFRYECHGSSAITNIKIDDDNH